MTSLDCRDAAGARGDRGMACVTSVFGVNGEDDGPSVRRGGIVDAVRDALADGLVDAKGGGGRESAVGT